MARTHGDPVDDPTSVAGRQGRAGASSTPAWAPTATRRRIRCSPNFGRQRRSTPGGRRWAFRRAREGAKQIFSAYTFDAVKAVFTDNKTFSTRCYEAIVRPLQGPTILEMQEPEHAVYRKLHEFAFARSSMRRWEAELVRPLVERTVDRLRDAKRADLVEEVFMPIPVRVIAALIGLPEADIPEFHRLGDRSARLPLRHGQCAAGRRRS